MIAVSRRLVRPGRDRPGRRRSRPARRRPGLARAPGPDGGRGRGRVREARCRAPSSRWSFRGAAAPSSRRDKKGKWAIGGIAAGNWNLDVEAPGFTTRQVVVSLPTEFARLAPIEIKLEKAVDPGPPAEIMAALKDGEAAYDAGRFTEARELYEKALADPKVAAQPAAKSALHLRIARALSQEEQYEKELVHLQAVLDMEPGNIQVKTLMAQEAIKGGMLEKGTAILAEIETQVKDPDVFFNVGVLFLNQGKSRRRGGLLHEGARRRPQVRRRLLPARPRLPRPAEAGGGQGRPREGRGAGARRLRAGGDGQEGAGEPQVAGSAAAGPGAAGDTASAKRPRRLRGLRPAVGVAHDLVVHGPALGHEAARPGWRGRSRPR